MSKIVLLGDSITENLPYVFKGTIGKGQDEVKNYGIENIGAGGYLKYVWPHVDHENVDIYVLLIGINNILRPDCDYDEEETLDDTINKIKKLIITIIDEGKKRLIVQSIYPTAYKEKNKEVIEVNSQIESICSQAGAEYLDIYSLLIDQDGLFDTRYRKDAIHPNSEGYEIIIREVNNKLNSDNVVKCK